MAPDCAYQTKVFERLRLPRGVTAIVGGGGKTTLMERLALELAAEAVGVPAAQIAKTLSFRAGEAGCRLIVAAGDARVDNRRYKDAFHEKARFLTPEEAVALTGHAVGGVCPFALPAGVKVYLDESLRRFDTVYPAAGSSNSAVRLSCAELERCAGADGWVDVCKGWRADEQS